eukprot:RCo017943
MRQTASERVRGTGAIETFNKCAQKRAKKQAHSAQLKKGTHYAHGSCSRCFVAHPAAYRNGVQEQEAYDTSQPRALQRPITSGATTKKGCETRNVTSRFPPTPRLPSQARSDGDYHTGGVHQIVVDPLPGLWGVFGHWGQDVWSVVASLIPRVRRAADCDPQPLAGGQAERCGPHVNLHSPQPVGRNLAGVGSQPEVSIAEGRRQHQARASYAQPDEEVGLGAGGGEVQHGADPPDKLQLPRHGRGGEPQHVLPDLLSHVVIAAAKDGVEHRPTPARGGVHGVVDVRRGWAHPLRGKPRQLLSRAQIHRHRGGGWGPNRELPPPRVAPHDVQADWEHGVRGNAGAVVGRWGGGQREVRELRRGGGRDCRLP